STQILGDLSHFLTRVRGHVHLCRLSIVRGARREQGGLRGIQRASDGRGRRTLAGHGSRTHGVAGSLDVRLLTQLVKVSDDTNRIAFAAQAINDTISETGIPNPF